MTGNYAESGWRLTAAINDRAQGERRNGVSLIYERQTRRPEAAIARDKNHFRKLDGPREREQ